MSETPTGDRPEELVPHEYWPSWEHMGDCAVCGNVADHPIHLPRVPLPPPRGRQLPLELQRKE